MVIARLTAATCGRATQAHTKSSAPGEMAIEAGAVLKLPLFTRITAATLSLLLSLLRPLLRQLMAAGSGAGSGLREDPGA